MLNSCNWIYFVKLDHTQYYNDCSVCVYVCMGVHVFMCGWENGSVCVCVSGCGVCMCGWMYMCVCMQNGSKCEHLKTYSACVTVIFLTHSFPLYVHSLVKLSVCRTLWLSKIMSCSLMYLEISTDTCYYHMYSCVVNCCVSILYTSCTVSCLLIILNVYFLCEYRYVLLNASVLRCVQHCVYKSCRCPWRWPITIEDKCARTV